MDSTVLIAFIGVAGTIGGVYLGHILNKKSTKETINATFAKFIGTFSIQEFTKQTVEFRDSFKNMVAFIEEPVRENVSGPNFQVASKISSDFGYQKNAMIKFKVHLPEIARIKFNKIWQEYEQSYHTIKPEEPYIPKNEQKTRNIIKNQINELFHFTNPENVFN